jgi:hypothetical protein
MIADTHLLPLALRPIHEMVRLLGIASPPIEIVDERLGAPCALSGTSILVEQAFLFEFRTDADAIWVTLAYEIARLRWSTRALRRAEGAGDHLDSDPTSFTAGELLAASHRSPTRAEAALLRVLQRYGTSQGVPTHGSAELRWDALLAGWVSWATSRSFV